jgi:hypothetical protein
MHRERAALRQENTCAHLIRIRFEKGERYSCDSALVLVESDLVGVCELSAKDSVGACPEALDSAVAGVIRADVDADCEGVGSGGNTLRMRVSSSILR